MKKFLIAGVAVAAIASVSPALAGAAVQTNAAPEAHKGPAKALTRAEMTQKVQQHFARLDANNDGLVTKAEADAATANVRQRVQQRAAKRGSAMFDRFDTNKDGIVTRAEAEPFFNKGSAAVAHAGPGDSKPRHNWDALAARLDSNKDGAISRAEFDAGHAAMRQRVEQRRGKAGMRHGGLGHMFEMADTNKDGNVTLAEATAAAAAHFEAADANRDGTLTPDEMRQARQKMRANAPRS